MKYAVTNRHKFALGLGVPLLSIVLLLSPVGRRGVAVALSDVVQIGVEVIEFSCKVVAGFRNLSRNPLDPTCPQCI